MARPLNCGKCNKPKRPKGKAFKNKEGYCICGRPTIMDATMLQKLEDAFTNAFSDEQACAYANISPSTLYNYQRENPEFVKRKEALKLRPDIKAKQTVVGSLGNTGDAWRWLERRDPEFKPVSKVEHGGAIEVADVSVDLSDEEKQAISALRIARRKRIEQQARDKAKQS